MMNAFDHGIFKYNKATESKKIGGGLPDFPWYKIPKWGKCTK
jgi:hypothetical protein